jgi:hypothetical protein
MELRDSLRGEPSEKSSEQSDTHPADFITAMPDAEADASTRFRQR